MKKNHLFISISTFLIVFLCAGFISCGGDDENDGTGNGDVPKEIAGIVGQWYSETIKNTTYAGKFSNIRVITLNADRTGTWTWAQYNYDKKTLKYIERYTCSHSKWLGQVVCLCNLVITLRTLFPEKCV